MYDRVDRPLVKTSVSIIQLGKCVPDPKLRINILSNSLSDWKKFESEIRLSNSVSMFKKNSKTVI